MKYLYSLFALCTIGVVVSAQDPYHGRTFNEDVTRKINLETTSGLAEIQTEFRVRPASQEEARSYYYVIPSHLEEHLISIQAVIATSQN